jgi:hypothetical protein
LFYFQYFFFYLSLGSYYYCNNRSLSFLFHCCAKKNLYLSEVRFGEVAVLKQILVLHRKNSWKFSEYLFDLRFLVHMPQVIYKLSLVLHFSIWATEGPRKNWPLSVVLFWQISTTICVCLSIAFFLSFFTKELLGKLLQYYMLYMWCFWVETWTKKGRFTIMFMLTLLIELC